MAMSPKMLQELSVLIKDKKKIRDDERKSLLAFLHGLDETNAGHIANFYEGQPDARVRFAYLELLAHVSDNERIMMIPIFPSAGWKKWLRNVGSS